MTADFVRPTSEEEIAAFVADAASSGMPLEILGLTLSILDWSHVHDR